MTRTHRRPLLVCALLLAACGGPAAAVLTPSPDGKAPTARVAPARLLLRVGQSPAATVEVLDTARARVVASRPDGVVSSDGTRLYLIARPDARTLLQAIDLRTNRVINTVEVPRDFALPARGASATPAGLSPDGSRLVLVWTSPDTQSAQTIARFVVYDTGRLERPPRQVILTGSFAFDAVDDAGTSLYLLEDLRAPAAGDAYHVRRVDLTTGRLDPIVIADKRTGEQTLTGSDIDSSFSRDGAWQYTVFAFGDGAPMVHALNLESGVAFCIDLPRGPSDESLDLLWSVVASADGGTVYAVNAGIGAVVAMRAASPWQTRTGSFSVPTATDSATWAPWAPVVAEAKRIVYGAAAISPDGRIVYAIGDRGVVAIDAATLSSAGTMLAGAPISSLSISADGRLLYATRTDASLPIVQIDVRTHGSASLAGATGAVTVLRAMAP